MAHSLLFREGEMLMPHNPVKLLHKYHLLLLILAFGTSVILQAVLRSEGMVGFKTALADFNILLFVMGLMNSLVWMCSRKSIFAGLETYFRAAAVVLEDYVLLTTLNKRYIEMVTIPLMIFAFIAALWFTLPVPKLGTQNEYRSGEISLEKEKESSYQSEENLLKKDAQSQYQSKEVPLEENTQTKDQNEEVRLEGYTQSEYESGEISLEKDHLPSMHREYQSEDSLLKKDTQGEKQSEEVNREEDTQSQYQSEEVPLEENTQTEDQNGSGEDPVEKCTQWELMKVAMVPHFIQLSLGVWFQSKGQLEDGIFIVSNFLLFFSSALCALTVMMASPPIGLNPGVVVQVLPVMHKTSIIMLMMTAHAMAAEWLREDIVFVCVPELAALLAWFNVYLCHPEHGVSIKVATSRRSCVIVLGSVGAILICLASFYAEDRIILTSMLRRHLLLILWENVEDLLLDFEEKMQEPWREAFGSILAIVLTLLAIYTENIPGVKWNQHLQIKNKRRPRLTPDISMLQGRVDVVDKSFNKLMPQDIIVSLDLPFIRVTLNGIVYWLHRFSEHADANNVDVATAHNQGIKEWFEQASQHHDAELIHEVQSGFDKVTDEVTEHILPPDANPQLTGLYTDSCSLDEQRKYYLQKMMAGAGTERREVVCIFPMDDLEKTELAFEVCERIKGKFSCHVSVSAGWKPDMPKLIMNMIKQVDSQHIGTGDAGDVDQLTKSLKQLLQNHSYLVMIDDLRSTDQWMAMESCFPENNLGSRIIITTRIEDAAKAGGPVPVEAEVETLFSRKVSGSMSGVFDNKPQTKDACERSGLQRVELEQMKQFIKVTYNSLSPDLRACLLYLSIFPANHEIDIERLVRLWLANGFIRRRENHSMEDTAGCHIHELIARKLIKPSQWSHDGTPRSCTVHRVIHEFIVWQATKNKFVCLIHAEQRGASLSPSNPAVRWLSLQNSTKLDIGADLSYVRSVTVLGKASALPPQTKLSSKRLRVLDLEGCEGAVLLDGLWELLHLRYLSLRGTDISELPEKIAELIYLQTLDVRSTKVKELPPSIVGLENLMHLLAGNAKLPHEISKMKALVTLSCANNRSWGSSASVLKELGEIANLRELELFCEVTQSSGDKKHMPDDEKQVVFMRDGFQTLNKLHIQGSFPSLSFKIGALPNVQVLELNFEKGHPEESAGVSGIEHLLSLEHVLLEFSHHGGGTTATYAAVKEAAKIHPNKHLKVTICS
uniref:Putative disease resistance RPP13-like protein 3 n=1 Tax=Aegilops tauschii TaxID=37682 RepID=M8BB66_AEGTA